MTYMSASKTAVLVLGSAGRMGIKIIEKVRENPRCSLSGAFDLKVRNCSVTAPGLETALSAADAAIDFTTPASGVAHAALCAKHRKPLVIGTTGFDAAQLALIKKYSETAPIFMSPNMSPAVNLTIAIARLMAARLPDFDICISETHHKLKKDAPSGTALRYARAVAAARGGVMPPITSARAGDIVGEHTVLYAGPHERIELTHRAHSRAVFAAGALKAAAWLCGRRPGFYDYLDLLGLKGLR